MNTSADAAGLKGRQGWRRVLNAFGYSWAGLRGAVIGEAAFRQLLFLNLLLIPIVLILEITTAERALLIGVSLLTLVVELLNSAIEAAVDRISLELHPLSARAKDMGSAAQSVTLVLLASIWACVLRG
ncbi:MAG: diacylglycerol kinase [Gammaproteobacteria bacterium]|nr:diacylglycerol kinase [Gammaproteobacteria bacterium]MBQ0841175.1 diacylglycerol kinase [Gammaproteobacteria bacterium]